MDISSISAYTDYMKTQNTSADKLSETLQVTELIGRMPQEHQFIVAENAVKPAKS